MKALTSILALAALTVTPIALSADSSTASCDASVCCPSGPCCSSDASCCD